MIYASTRQCYLAGAHHPADRSLRKASVKRGGLFGRLHRSRRSRKRASKAMRPLAELVGQDGTAALFLTTAYEPRNGWDLVAAAPLLEMVCERRFSQRTIESAPEISRLGPEDSPEMVALAALTKPGPFGSRTHELGTYLGIRRDGKLVAMAGERLKVPGYTEVSAVCTHPDHIGKGYAGPHERSMRGFAIAEKFLCCTCVPTTRAPWSSTKGWDFGRKRRGTSQCCASSKEFAPSRAPARRDRTIDLSTGGSPLRQRSRPAPGDRLS